MLAQRHSGWNGLKQMAVLAAAWSQMLAQRHGGWDMIIWLVFGIWSGVTVLARRHGGWDSWSTALRLQRALASGNACPAACWLGH